MGISTKTRYALRAMLYMAINGGKDKPISLREISKAEKITIDYLIQIFQILKKRNLVRSIRGPRGGFVLKKSPDKLSLYDIARALGEEPVDNFCAKNIVTCKKLSECIVKYFWKDLRNYINSYCKKVTLSEIIKNYGGRFIYERTEKKD